MNDPFNQELPHKDEAERTVLGAMLQSRAAIDEARQKITENDFYQPNNKTIYRLICDLSDQHGDVDTTLLCMTLTERKKLDHVGGLNYVASSSIMLRPRRMSASTRTWSKTRRNDATSSPSAPA